MLRALLRTMHLYEAHHFQTLPLRLKGTAWLADLSENNIALEIPELSSNDVAPHLDFIGPDLDMGFRLSKFARPASLLLSLDLVEMRSEEHTSELQSLLRISYAVLCLQKNKK